MYQDRKVYAVLLAAGSGSRMHAKEKKQFMELCGKPVFVYSLLAFEKSTLVDEIVLVTAAEDKKKVLEASESYGIRKLSSVAEGGSERYHSVLHALLKIAETNAGKPSADHAYLTGNRQQDPIVLIHDSARPMLTEKLIRDSVEGAAEYHAAVVGMPVKDTIKILDRENYVASTPDRSTLWLMQTPQSFDFSLIYQAYTAMAAEESKGGLTVRITDDAQVLEHFMHIPVKIIPGSYENIKITTPEDIKIAGWYLTGRD